MFTSVINEIFQCFSNTMFPDSQQCNFSRTRVRSFYWLPLSLTNYLTDSFLVDLIDVTLACEDDNPKLVEVVTAADVDAEKRVDDSLVQIWKLNFVQKVKFLFRL